MIIHLVQVQREADGSPYGVKNIEWDTNKPLPSISSSRYGAEYRFAGIDSQPAGTGALTLTVAFRDVAELTAFRDLSLVMYELDPPLTDVELTRWRKFTDAVESLTETAPQRPLTDQMVLSDPPIPIGYPYGEKSYHAGIDPVRGF